MPLFLLRMTFIILVITLLASASVPELEIIHGLTIGRAGYPLSVFETLTLLLYFWGFSICGLAVEYAFGRKGPASSIERHIRETLILISGLCITIVAIFSYSTVTVNPNFFLYAGFLVLASSAIQLVIEFMRRGNTPALEFKLARVVKSAPLIATATIFMALSYLTWLYKADMTFRNEANYFRSRAIQDTHKDWILEDVFSGIRFEQLMYAQVCKTDPEGIYLLTRTGKLLRAAGDEEGPQTLLDLSSSVNTRIENGALGFALHPEYGVEDSDNRGYVYIYYTTMDKQDQLNIISRFDLSLARGDRLASELKLISQRRKPNGYHNGGTLAFGPDGFLYFSIGDMKDGLGHQTLSYRLLGGIFRIDVDMKGGAISQPVQNTPNDGETAHYFIPLSNPFIGVPGALEEYWALGLRNPFRFSIDAGTGDLWVGDVGWNSYEEVNRILAGANGGWPAWEGPTQLGNS
ncbi:MAG: hypothetical protein HOC23_04805, partial [Halieaceae bacterium]|nr:hypothetical protein [Halieaceae bacterium]